MTPYVYLAAAVAFVVALGGAYWQGRTDGAAAIRVQWNEAITKAQELTERQRKADEEKARKLSSRYEARIATQAATNREISDALERAIGKANLPASCNLDDGLLDAWNAANRGESKASGKLPDGTSGSTGAKVKVD